MSKRREKQLDMFAKQPSDSPGARRAAAHRKRLADQGFRPAMVWIRQADWEAGFLAGERGEPLTPPAGIDGFSWSSGYVEGKAKRDGFVIKKGARNEING